MSCISLSVLPMLEYASAKVGDILKQGKLNMAIFDQVH